MGQEKELSMNRNSPLQRHMRDVHRCFLGLAERPLFLLEGCVALPVVNTESSYCPVRQAVPILAFTTRCTSMTLQRPSLLRSALLQAETPKL